MTTLYEFAAGYTKAGVGVAPSSAPTITVVDSANNVLVSAATATTALGALVGAYRYSYSGADGLTCYGLFHTTDVSVDQQDLFVIAVINPVVRLVQTDAAAIKVVTDQMRFTIANQIDSNALSGGGGSPPSAATIAAAVLDEAKGTHTGLIAVALPAVAPAAAGGLPTVAAGAAKLAQTVDLTASQSIAVSDKTGFSLSTAGILAIWNQLETDAGIIANSFGAKLHTWLVSTSGKVTAIVNRWLTDDAAGTPLALTGAFKVQADAGASGLTAQQTRDAMLLAPTAPGLGAEDSIDDKLDDIPTNPLLDNSALLPATVIAAKSDIPVAPIMPNVGADGSVLISTDPQDLSITLDVNAKLIDGNTPENISVQQVWDALLAAFVTPGSIGELLAQFRFTVANQVDANAITGGGGGGIAAIDVWNELLASMVVPNSVGDLMVNLTTVIDTALSLTHGNGLWGGSMGTGSVLYVPDRATDPLHVPLDGVNTWVTTDLTDPTLGLVARAYTDAFGMITPGFMLDPGNYAVWRQRAGDTFANPQLVTI